MYDEDDLLTHAFNDFADSADRTLHVARPSVIRGAALHRRRVRAVTMSLAAMVIVALPVSAYGILSNRSPNPPNPASSTEPVPSAEPSESPSPSASRSSTLDGQFTREQLIGATITLPGSGNQGCSGGTITPRNEPNGQGSYWVGRRLVHTNLDGDPALETAVEILCEGGDPSPLWLTALDRAADGKIVTLGVIVGPASQGVPKIANLAPREGGGVNVAVCSPCGSDPSDSNWKNRQYFWDGSKFAGSDQPRAWVTDLSVSTSNISATRNADKLLVTFTVTVTNRGNLTSGGFYVMFPKGGEPITVSPATWAAPMGQQPPITAEPIGPGASRKITVTVTERYSEVYPLENWISVELIQLDETQSWIHEPDRQNNTTQVKDFTIS